MCRHKLCEHHDGKHRPTWPNRYHHYAGGPIVGGLPRKVFNDQVEKGEVGTAAIMSSVRPKLTAHDGDDDDRCHRLPWASIVGRLAPDGSEERGQGVAKTSLVDESSCPSQPKPATPKFDTISEWDGGEGMGKMDWSGQGGFHIRRLDLAWLGFWRVFPKEMNEMRPGQTIGLISFSLSFLCARTC